MTPFGGGTYVIVTIAPMWWYLPRLVVVLPKLRVRFLCAWSFKKKEHMNYFHGYLNSFEKRALGLFSYISRFTVQFFSFVPEVCQISIICFVLYWSKSKIFDLSKTILTVIRQEMFFSLSNELLIAEKCVAATCWITTFLFFFIPNPITFFRCCTVLTFKAKQDILQLPLKNTKSLFRCCSAGMHRTSNSISNETRCNSGFCQR